MTYYLIITINEKSGNEYKQFLLARIRSTAEELGIPTDCLRMSPPSDVKGESKCGVWVDCKRRIAKSKLEVLDAVASAFWAGWNHRGLVEAENKISYVPCEGGSF